MQSDDQKRIEIQIEGLPEDGGAVRLNVLYNFLAEVRRVLAAVEREVTGSDRASLSYKVTTLSYASPVRCVLEPISKKTKPELGNAVATRFAREYDDVKKGAATDGMEPYTLEQFERLAAQRKQAGNICLGLENETSPITPDFNDQLRKLLGNIYRSRSTFRGKLEAVNIHSSPCVLHIYPIIGPAKIRCIYPKGRFPRIGEYLGNTVDIHGILKYRGDELHPYEIEIEEITQLKTPGGTLIADSLAGSMPDITGGKDIATYLREIRNE